MPERTANPWRALDLEQLRRLVRVPMAKRVRAMLEAEALVAVNIVRGRLHRQHPYLSPQETNMLVIQEVSRHD